jgi:hypothetical protein
MSVAKTYDMVIIRKDLWTRRHPEPNTPFITDRARRAV